MAFRPFTERFWEKVDRNDPDDCWDWTGALSHGYGHIKAEAPSRDVVYAHRASYEMLVGPIPEGLHIDHLCRNTRCVNPKHLEPVTRAENARRINTVALTADIDACRRRGHAYTLENTAINSATGRRYCRECQRIAGRQWYVRVGRDRRGAQPRRFRNRQDVDLAGAPLRILVRAAKRGAR